MSIIKQSLEKAEFPEIEWEKPENKRQKGELCIVGGSPHGFASVGNSFEYVQKAGIGRASVIMPEATRKTIEGFIKESSFLPSTVSGSFSKQGLTELKALAQDNNATLLAGDFGRNSETALLIEGFMMSHVGRIVLSKDAVDFAATSYPRQLLNREDTIVVASLSQLQKALKSTGVEKNITFNMTARQLAEFLETLSAKQASHIITVHHDMVFVAVDGKVSMTPTPFEQGLWQTLISAFAAVYWIQHPAKPFSALTTAVFDALQGAK